MSDTVTEAKKPILVKSAKKVAKPKNKSLFRKGEPHPWFSRDVDKEPLSVHTRRRFDDETEIEITEPEALLGAAAAEKPLDFAQIFGDAMGPRISALVDARKQLLAQSYLGVQSDSGDEQPDEEDIDDDELEVEDGDEEEAEQGDEEDGEEELGDGEEEDADPVDPEPEDEEKEDPTH